MKSHLKQQWFETFFQGPAVEFWTNAMTPALTLADVDFLEKTFAVKPGARLLDVPCGNGRHSIELARRGYRITGIDLSQEFLAAARSELDADWRFGDMRALELEPSAFEGAFCFGNSFGYLDCEGAGAFLSSIAAALKPGAKLVIETGVAAESILPTMVARRWHRFGDLFIASENRYDAAASRLDIDYTFIRGGTIETRPAASYVFTVAEIGRMLESAGFEVLARHSGLAGEPYQLGSPRLIITAKRTGA
ncbi:MAG TPA: methyltransferase domain-containing protein [Bryobacteraceae bacterium]|nr:methyltransferase domain-containing protein [Bryobacteraceae bacterium]